MKGVGSLTRNFYPGIQAPTLGYADGYGQGLVLSPGEYYTHYQRFNFPTALVTKDDNWMMIGWHTKPFPQGQTAAGVALDARDKQGAPVAGHSAYFKGSASAPSQMRGYITDIWRSASKIDQDLGWSPDVSTPANSYRTNYIPAGHTFKRGHINNSNLKVNSDLMITELLTTEFNQRQGSFGILEIYNPTLDPIDVSQYALLRFGYRNDRGTFKVRNLPATAEDATDGKRGDFLVKAIDKALLLPLTLGGASTDWSVNSFNRPMKQTAWAESSHDQHPYASSIAYTAYAGRGTTYSEFSNVRVVDFSKTSYFSGLKTVVPGSTYIAPGKTMLVLFSGYAKSGYQPTEGDRQLFARIQKAVDAGYCDYVVALSHGDEQAAPHTAKAGVTTADIGDGFSLVRIASLVNRYTKTTKSDGSVSENFWADPVSRIRVKTRVVVDGTWNSLHFDAGDVVKNLITRGAKAIVRRPYGPHLWNTGFQNPINADRYQQKAYTSADETTLGAPYFSSFDSDKTWEAVVKPRIDKRNANLLK